MAKSKSSTSLYLYTALIFLVALLMIILSFFAQGEREALKQETQTLTEKASAVSEQNMLLTEQVADLTKQLEEKTTAVDTLTKESEAYKSVISAYERMLEDKNTEAYEIISGVDAAILTDDTLALYNQITETLKKLNIPGKEEQ